MIKENISLDFSLKKTNGRKNYCIDEIKQRDFMIRKNKKSFWNYKLR